MKTLILSLIFSAVIFAGDVVQTNPQVEKAMASAVADASKAYDAYQVALAKATDTAVAKLTALQTDFTKKGDLDNAVLVKTKIEELKAGKMVEIIAEMKKPVTGADLLPTTDQDPAKAILGKWNFERKSYPGVFLFKEKKVCSFTNNGEEVVGSYDITKETVLVRLANGTSYEIKLPLSGTIMCIQSGKSADYSGALVPLK